MSLLHVFACILKYLLPLIISVPRPNFLHVSCGFVNEMRYRYIHWGKWDQTELTCYHTHQIFQGILYTLTDSKVVDLGVETYVANIMHLLLTIVCKLAPGYLVKVSRFYFFNKATGHTRKTAIVRSV